MRGILKNTWVRALEITLIVVSFLERNQIARFISAKLGLDFVVEVTSRFGAPAGHRLSSWIAVIIAEPRLIAVIVTGIVFVSVFGPGRPKALHLTLFIVLGWCGLIFLPRMVRENLPLFVITLSGGIIYTLGIIPFALKRKGAHFLWHFFVFFGAAVHWFGIWQFLYGA